MENNLENAMSFLLNAKNASQYEEADDEVTDRWSVFASIMQRYAIQFESQIAENKATHAEEKLLLITTIQRLRAELEALKVVVPSEEEIQACAVRCAEKDASLTQHEQVFVVAGFYHGAKWMHSQIATAPTGDKSDGG